MLGKGRIASGPRQEHLLLTEILIEELADGVGGGSGHSGRPESIEPILVRDECWDVFILDDETTEPEPERGDFWGDVDDSETLWRDPG